MRRRRGGGDAGDDRFGGGDAASSLALLQQTDRVFVRQHVEHFEALTGWEGENSYDIVSADGTLMFRAQEHSNVCCRQMCKSQRSFTMTLTSAVTGAPFIRLERPISCCWSSIEVYNAGGARGEASHLLGKVQRTFALFSRCFSVVDPTGAVLFTITSPMFEPWTFYLCDARGDGARIGRISKEWSGLAQELFTDADNFGIEWPLYVTMPEKALLLGAVFLIDFQFFEDNDMNSQSRRRGGGRGRRGGGGGGIGFGMF